MDINTFLKRGYEINEKVEEISTYKLIHDTDKNYDSIEDLLMNDNESILLHTYPNEDSDGSKYDILKNGSVLKSDLNWGEVESFILDLEEE